ncbi:hypothetical protein [Psychroserpens sp.]|uniref:hypothetical protein n=1 Tax=Psychroserpens sp. TaxID=2020870 RepID=UPI001B092089|nr:hypothetical protein [Psychroserpens sp.]MBO6606741.1 hypothetical protein [Psychroserpens sp.]MBO6631784.1 hypothetical protein [Psychroserpens sp.]MBO6653444.1 hypothetical protein [Psychroserpens sp.]MBO6680528.1 hypothetical protein [Psychroserpens sp.]MBO6750513.1 hypothetical protein [Psychroserpens sp.]
MWEERLKIYDHIVAQCANFERKGKNMIYTSANGYMFTLLNKDAEIGIRLSKPSQETFKTQYNTTEYRSYGAVMRDYVKVPDELLDNTDLMVQYFNESYNYVMSLPPK